MNLVFVAADVRRLKLPGQKESRASLPRLLRGAWSRFAALLAALAILTGCVSTTVHQQSLTRTRFDFALIGDVPYTDEAVTNLFPNMIAGINRARLAFVVHDGDIKSGDTPCTDERLAQCRAQFDTFRHPLIYIFGDNEWSDCGKVKEQPFDPLDRLAKLRALFTPGHESLGRRKLRLDRQSDDPRFAPFRENVRWTYGGVLFAGLNLPGDRNNFGQPEFAARHEANLAWLRDAFAQAKRQHLRALMLIIQANPFPERGSTNKVAPGFKGFLAALEEETVAFGQPVVLVHGDSHYFRLDKPLVGTASRRRIENFTRVETFGYPDVHWLRATVDWREPEVFRFRQEIVRQNLVRRRR